MKKYFLILISAILCLTHFAGCNSCSENSGSDTTISVKIKAVVMSYEGLPLDSVRVSMGDTVVFTNKRGEFSMPATNATSDRFVMRLQKDGYFDRIFSKQVVDSTFSEIRMVRKENSDHCVLTSFDSDKGITVTVQKAVVYIPASALMVQSTGEDYNGKVNISVIYYNPDETRFSTMFPGGDLLAINAKGEKGVLLSYGMLDVEMRDPDGNLLQLKKGKTSQLSFPVPQNKKNHTPKSIPLWHFSDTTGLWREDGVSYLKGDKYVGNVTHFSSWNCDVFSILFGLSVRFVDQNGGLIHGDYPFKVGVTSDDRDYSISYLSSHGTCSTYIPIFEGWIEYGPDKQRRPFTLSPACNTVVEIKLPLLQSILVNVVDQNNNPIPDCVVLEKSGNFGYMTDQKGSFVFDSDNMNNFAFEVCGAQMLNHPTYKDVVNGQLTIKCALSETDICNSQKTSTAKVISKSSQKAKASDTNGNLTCKSRKKSKWNFNQFVYDGFFSKEDHVARKCTLKFEGKKYGYEHGNYISSMRLGYSNDRFVEPKNIDFMKKLKPNIYLICFKDRSTDTLKIENGVFKGCKKYKAKPYCTANDNKKYTTAEVYVELNDNVENFSISNRYHKETYGFYNHFLYELVYSDAKGHKQTANATAFSADAEPINPNGPVMLKSYYYDEEFKINHMKITDKYQIDGPIFNGSGNIIPISALNQICEAMAAKLNNTVHFELDANRPFIDYDYGGFRPSLQKNQELINSRYSYQVRTYLTDNDFTARGWRLQRTPSGTVIDNAY